MLPVLLGIVLGAYLLLQGEQQRLVFADVVSPAIECLAALLLFMASRASMRESKRLGNAWGILALAMFLYALGDITWGVLELGLKQAPFPSIADGFYLLYYPVFLVGVALLLRKPADTGELLNNALDLTIILAAAVLGFWNFLIGPTLLSNAGAPALERAILVAYPVGDLVLVGALLLIFYNDPGPEYWQGPAEHLRAGLRPRLQPSTHQQADRPFRQPTVPVFLLSAGMLAMIVTDCIYSYQALTGSYVSGGVLDLGWVLANVLLGMAGVSQWIALRPRANPGYEPGPTFRAALVLVKTYLPYLWLLGAFLLLIAGALTPLPMRFTTIAASVGVILTLVLARQLITLSQNHKLNTQLTNQTIKLESTNRDLNLEIAERLRVQEKLAFDVLHDQMTGLANRRLFLDRLGQALKRTKRHHEQSLAVLFLDLDQFKVVNDSLGHSFGDRLLIAVGKRLDETLRSGDTVARFGGDEFAILLDDLDDEACAQMLAERIQEVLKQPFRIQDRDVHITASIGISSDLSHYEYPDDLLRDVDLAMYQAKALGKARCVKFQVEMRDQAFSRLAMEEGLRNALQNREFQLYYQPITSLESDRMVGFEALLRWFHPTKGLLLPADFLSVAEESGLMLPIGDWVLNEACRQLKLWQDRHPDQQGVTVNVNISNNEFSQPDLAERVANALKTSGLSGACLRLEITERVLVSNYPTANGLIEALQQMGVQVQIDDFGTGYSALAYLQQFPINAIKIDQSFIHEMRSSRKGLGLVRAIVSMARELGMSTIAEGIETEEQLNELKGLLCGFGQGFLLSVPLDAAAAEQAITDLDD